MSFGWYMRRVNWYGCPNCKVEYRTQQAAINCRDGHVRYGDRPSPAHHNIGTGMPKLDKIETYITEDGKRFCGKCSAKVKDTDIHFIYVEMVDPGICSRCDRPIVNSDPVYNPTAPLMTPHERHNQNRLDLSKGDVRLQFRRRLHDRLRRAQAHSIVGDATLPPTRTEEAKAYDEGLKRQFGGYRNDPTYGHTRYKAAGTILPLPGAEPVAGPKHLRPK